MYSFPDLEPVCCFMCSPNCCFLTCIQISQEAGQWSGIQISFKNFPHFVVIHTVKGFGIVNKAEVDVFLELSCFFDDPTDVGNLISGSSAFSKTSLNIREFTVHVTPYYQIQSQIRWSGIPISFRFFHSLLWSTQSKALAWSIKQKYMFLVTLMHFWWSSGC